MADLHTRAIKLFLVLQIALQVVQPLGLEFKVGQDGLRKVFIETEPKYNWFKAEIECVRKNMSLIALDTAEKSDALDKILREQFGEICPYLWIGGHDLANESQFVWITTGKPFEFTNWKKGMPDNFHNKEDCVHVAHDRDWNDIKCGFKFGFICQG